MRKLWKQLVIGSPFVMLMALFLWWAQPAYALTTADVTVNATPSYISISVDNSTYDFGIVTASSVTNSTTDYFNIDNTSSIQTDQTISVTTALWLGGTNWTHAENGTAAADTAGLKANKDGTWGVSDVIVQNVTPDFIAENQAANTDYAFGLQLLAPTSFSDGTNKVIVVRVTAAAG